MKVSAAIAEICRREGVNVIFSYPRNMACAHAPIEFITAEEKRASRP